MVDIIPEHKVKKNVFYHLINSIEISNSYNGNLKY